MSNVDGYKIIVDVGCLSLVSFSHKLFIVDGIVSVFPGPGLAIYYFLLLN